VIEADDVGLLRLRVIAAEPQSLESADAEVLGHDVQVAHELLEKLEATRSFQLEGDTELVPIPYCAAGTLLDAVTLALDAQGDALRPRSRDSTLITRAPMSARSIVQKGMAMNCPGLGP
jgi:hypothetical protein